jgi:hypothetical protein
MEEMDHNDKLGVPPEPSCPAQSASEPSIVAHQPAVAELSTALIPSTKPQTSSKITPAAGATVGSGDAGVNSRSPDSHVDQQTESTAERPGSGELTRIEKVQPLLNHEASEQPKKRSRQETVVHKVQD